MSSRLFQNIREKMGICYSIYSMRTFFDDLTLWIIYASTGIETISALIQALGNEIQGAFEHQITEEEIQSASTHLIGGVSISKDDMETRMKRLVRQYVLGGEIHDIPKTIEILKSITRNDITRFIDTSLKYKPFNLLAYGTKRLHRKKKDYFTFGSRNT